jgi:hypothetical protein
MSNYFSSISSNNTNQQLNNNATISSNNNTIQPAIQSVNNLTNKNVVNYNNIDSKYTTISSNNKTISEPIQTISSSKLNLRNSELIDNNYATVSAGVMNKINNTVKQNITTTTTIVEKPQSWIKINSVKFIKLYSVLSWVILVIYLIYISFRKYKLRLISINQMSWYIFQQMLITGTLFFSAAYIGSTLFNKK